MHMDVRISHQQAATLVQRLASPHIAIKRFEHYQQLYDLRRRPYATLPVEVYTAVEYRISEIMQVIDQALASPSLTNIQAVLQLPELKPYSFADEATIRRFLRSRIRPEDSVLLSKQLATLRNQLATL